MYGNEQEVGIAIQEGGVPGRDLLVLSEACTSLLMIFDCSFLAMFLCLYCLCNMALVRFITSSFAYSTSLILLCPDNHRGLHHENIFVCRSLLSGLFYVLCIGIFRSIPNVDIPNLLVSSRTRGPLTSRDECWTLGEEFVHVFQIQALGLRLEAPEEDGVR